MIKRANVNLSKNLIRKYARWVWVDDNTPTHPGGKDETPTQPPQEKYLKPGPDTDIQGQPNPTHKPPERRPDFWKDPSYWQRILETGNYGKWGTKPKNPRYYQDQLL